MPNRLKLPNSELFPIQAFFNAIPDSSFKNVIKNLSSGIGYTFNDVDCSFPADLDPNEPSFDGVRFSLFEESIVISIDQLHRILRDVCDAHLKTHPDDAQIIAEYLL